MSTGSWREAASVTSPTAFVNGRSSVIIREIVEHCGYNRTPGCALVDGRLQVRCLFNDSLLTSLRGAVWNFPAFRKGRFTVSLRFNDLATKGHLLLNDRWFNPTDSVARYYAPFDVPLSHKMLNISDNKPYLIRIDWNLDTKHPAAEVYVDNRKRLTVPLRNESQHGLSYVHFLSDTRIDDQGCEIEWVKAEVGR